MTINRYAELKLIEAFEYAKYSKEETWSFIIRVEDSKICFTGEANHSFKDNQIRTNIKLITEALTSLEFSLDAQHVNELIQDLRKMRLFSYINECITDYKNIDAQNKIKGFTEFSKSETNPQKLNGHWKEGWALDLHTSSSKPIKNEDGNITGWNTKRAPIAEELYRLKYWKEQYRVDKIAKPAAGFLNVYKSKWQLDLIIPIPPSDMTRDFQPVYEMAKSIGRLVELPVDFDTLRKVKSTSQLKEINDPVTRKEILKDVFSINLNKLSGKNVLVFDDIFRSGTTLNAVCDVIMNVGKARNVYCLTITKTRSKR